MNELDMMFKTFSKSNVNKSGKGQSIAQSMKDQIMMKCKEGTLKDEIRRIEKKEHFGYERPRCISIDQVSLYRHHIKDDINKQEPQQWGELAHTIRRNLSPSKKQYSFNQTQSSNGNGT